ncbi:MAG TPA: histidine phosphatase family protein [Candidatus Limnocylindrales bacterium]|jgi:phosphohistidine phosphatase
MIAVHLLRHAHAGDPERWTDDDSLRPLSEKGRRQCERLGRLLAGLDEVPDLFITSPRVRAAQTAELVADALGASVIVDRRLAAPFDIAVLEDLLLAHADTERPCLVGHDPDFSDLLAELVGASLMPMRKGAIARVDLPSRDLVPGRGVLRYLLPPEVVAGR